MGLPMGLLHMAASFPPKEVIQEGEQDQDNNVFSTPISEANLPLVLLYTIGQRPTLVQ